MIITIQEIKDHLFLALPVHHIENMGGAFTGPPNNHDGTAALLKTTHIWERFKERCDRLEAKGFVGQAVSNLR